MNKINSGVMPNTDFRYEEFEGLLASLYLTLKPLENSGEVDKKDWQAVVEILNGFAERQTVQLPEKTAAEPRPTDKTWGQPQIFKTCFSVWDMMGSFTRDFGIGFEEGIDFHEIRHLCQIILAVFKRHDVAKLKIKTINGEERPYGIEIDDSPKLFTPFRDAIL